MLKSEHIIPLIPLFQTLQWLPILLRAKCFKMAYKALQNLYLIFSLWSYLPLLSPLLMLLLPYLPHCSSKTSFQVICISSHVKRAACFTGFCSSITSMKPSQVNQKFQILSCLTHPPQHPLPPILASILFFIPIID